MSNIDFESESIEEKEKGVEMVNEDEENSSEKNSNEKN